MDISIFGIPLIQTFFDKRNRARKVGYLKKCKKYSFQNFKEASHPAPIQAFSIQEQKNLPIKMRDIKITLKKEKVNYNRTKKLSSKE